MSWSLPWVFIIKRSIKFLNIVTSIRIFHKVLFCIIGRSRRPIQLPVRQMLPGRHPMNITHILRNRHLLVLKCMFSMGVINTGAFYLHLLINFILITPILVNLVFNMVSFWTSTVVLDLMLPLPWYSSVFDLFLSLFTVCSTTNSLIRTTSNIKYWKFYSISSIYPSSSSFDIFFFHCWVL